MNGPEDDITLGSPADVKKSIALPPVFLKQLGIVPSTNGNKAPEASEAEMKSEDALSKKR